MSTTEPPHKVAGAALRVMRETAGITRSNMAERVGCSPGHLARVESGERPLTAALADRIARATADRILECVA